MNLPVLLCCVALLHSSASSVITPDTEVSVRMRVIRVSAEVTQVELTSGNRNLLVVAQNGVSENSICYTSTDKEDDAQDAEIVGTGDEILRNTRTTTSLLLLAASEVSELFKLCTNDPADTANLILALTSAFETTILPGDEFVEELRKLDVEEPATQHVEERVKRRVAKLRRQKRFGGWVVYPGTKWCGAGNAADNITDLGEFREADKCCRTHDHCDTTIRRWSSKYGLFNWYVWTVSHCSCDDAFSQCLQNVPSTSVEEATAATTITRIFFDMIGIRCFVFNKRGKAKYRNE